MIDAVGCFHGFLFAWRKRCDRVAAGEGILADEVAPAMKVSSDSYFFRKMTLCQSEGSFGSTLKNITSRR